MTAIKFYELLCKDIKKNIANQIVILFGIITTEILNTAKLKAKLCLVWEDWLHYFYCSSRSTLSLARGSKIRSRID